MIRNMGKKVSGRALALLLAVMVALASLIALPRIGARAEEDKDSFSQFLTDIKLTVDSGNGQPAQEITLKPGQTNVPTLEIKDSTTVRVHMDFSIDNGDNVQGKAYTLQLPPPLVMTSPVLRDLTNDEGEKYGNYTFDTNGLLTIRFTNTADKDQLSGYAWAEFTFSEEKIPGNEKEITFSIQGQSVPLKIDVLGPAAADATIYKEGTYDKKTGLIKWTVKITSGNDGKDSGLTDVVVTDTLSGDDQTFQSDPDASTQPTWKVGASAEQTVKDSGTELPYYEKTNDNKRITFYLGGMEHDKTGILTFYSKPAKSEKPVFPATEWKYNNKADLDAKRDGAPIDHLSAERVVPVSWDGSWIQKKGEVVKTNDNNKDYYQGNPDRPKTLKWTITLNQGGKGTIPAGATVTDKLPDNLKAYLTIGDQPKVQELQADGSYIDVNTGYTSTVKPEEDFLSVTFDQAFDTQRQITFTTTVAEEFYNTNGTFTNTASLGFGGKTAGATNDPGIEGLPDSSVISKTHPGTAEYKYDSATHMAHWMITVNSNGIAIENPVVTDEIGDGQIFSSVSIEGKDWKENPNTPRYEVSSDRKKVIIYLDNFADSDAPVVLDLVTEVTNPAIYAANKGESIENSKVELTGNNGGIKESVSHISQGTTSNILKKEAGTSDLVNRTLGWTVTVNESKMQMKDAVVTDTLPEGLSVKGITMGGKLIGPGTEGSAAPYYTQSGQEVAIHLGDSANKTTKIIQLDTTISDNFLATHNGDARGQITFTNKASLTFTDVYGLQSVPDVSANQTIHHTVVEKTGTFNGKSNSIIDWTVQINKDRVPYSALQGITDKITLADQLAEGLELDLQSVTLSRVSWEKGKAVKGDPIPLEVGSVSYDSSTRKFIFTFPQGVELFDRSDNSYELDFSTFVTKSGEYGNSVTLEGTAGSLTGGTQTKVSASAAGASIDGKSRKTVVITKVDKDNTNKMLPGAVFTLFVSTSGENGPFSFVATAVTGEDGAATFAHLRALSNYYYKIVETQPPKDYKNDSPEKVFHLPEVEETTRINYQFEDSSVSGNSSTPGGPGGPGDGGSSTPSSSAPSSSTPGGDDNPGGGGGGHDTSSSSTPSSSVPAPSVPGGSAGGGNVGEGTAHGGTGKGKPSAGPQTGDTGSPMIPMLAAILAAAAAVFTGNLILARRAKKSKKS